VIDAGVWSPTFGEGEPIVSYSQNAEDVRLWRVFNAVENGFYVDVGAADPNLDSVTRLFYERGWSGINVEPNPCYEALNEVRTRDVNLRVAVGESEQPVPFFLTYPYLGMSTLDPSVHDGVPQAIERIEEVAIQQRRLETILRGHASGRTIHFLKIDVEGAERQVLASSDWTAFRPIVVIAEAVEPLSTVSTHEQWEHILAGAGYRFAAFDGINRFYVERQHEHLIPALAYPVSALDAFVPASVADLQAKLRQADREILARAGETDDLRREVARVEAELMQARQELETVYKSRVWFAGQIIARATRPARAIADRLRRRWAR
jgi:FkbM family methyltransferase